MQQSSPPAFSPLLTDVFSTELTTLFEQARHGIVQVRNGQRGGGTGIVLSADGLILTNHHVVPRDHNGISVHFTDGRTLQAHVQHSHPELDLALLKADGTDLPALALATSAPLRVGEWVFAIGHPWGQRWAVTAGIVSALRTIKVSKTLSTQYIQSDVLLAPGNSGGPLLDADGNVAGVNAMIFGGDLSISIPANVVQNWLSGLPAQKAALGVGVQAIELPANLRASANTDQPTALLVATVRTEQNALLVGDILLTLNTTPVPDTASLRAFLATQKGGTTLSAQIIRGGALQTVTLTLGTLSQAS